MLDGLIDALRRAGSDLDRQAVERAAADRLTPLEVAGLADARAALPPEAQPWVDAMMAFAGLPQSPVQGHVRTGIAPSVELYADPRFPTGAKSLIVGLTGRANRLMLPLAPILQALPGDRCDLLLLRKPRHDHYDNGIAPWIGIVDTVRGLSAAARFDDYARIVTVGSSTGGFPALRYAIIAGAGRAVAIGGRMTWHIGRLTSAEEAEVPAFDLLCACSVERWPELVCAYAAHHAEDRTNARHLARIGPVRLIPVAGLAGHNIIEPIWRTGRLAAFFEELFRI